MPDRCDLEPVFAAAHEQKLSREQRKAIEDIHSTWRAADQATLNRMLMEYLAWNEKTCTNRSYVADEYATYAKRMASTFNSRIAGAEAAIAALGDVLTSRQRRDFTRSVERWRKDISRIREQQEETKARHSGWPGPYE